jgi:hypothetical protein
VRFLFYGKDKNPEYRFKKALKKILGLGNRDNLNTLFYKITLLANGDEGNFITFSKGNTFAIKNACIPNVVNR